MIRLHYFHSTFSHIQLICIHFSKSETLDTCTPSQNEIDCEIKVEKRIQIYIAKPQSRVYRL